MKRVYLAVVCLAAVCLLLSCAKTDNKVVVRVGEQKITVKMIKDEYLAVSPASRPDLKTIEEKENFVKDIAAKETMMLEAQMRGLDRLPEVAQERANGTARRAWQSLYEELVRAKVTVTDADLQAIYARQNYAYHLGWIFVRSASLAQQLVERIHRGESFEQLAATYSIDSSRSQNGDIGNRTLGSLPPPLDEAVLGMSPGQVSGAIPYDSYCVVLKLYEKTAAPQGTFEESREGLQAIGQAMAEGVRQREIAAQLRKDYKLELNPAVVDLIVAKTAAANPTPGGVPGQIPEFSDEEMSRELARWDGGAWPVRTYVERIGGVRDFMRPGYGVDREIVQSLVGDFITGELWQAELKKKGFDTRPEAIQAGQRAAEEVILTALHDDVVKDVKVDDARITSFYDEHKAELVTESATRIAVIVSADEAASKSVHDQLAAGAKFETLAAEKSVDQATAPNGGELMRPLYKQETEQFPDFQQALDQLSAGAYSSPIPVPPGFGPAGYMIVKVLERIEPRQLTLEEIGQDLRERVLAMEQDRVFGEWLTGKMTEFKVEIFPDVLSLVDFEALKSQGA
jgi:peptidyl-prolyl cis-trans isomerase C